MMKYAEDKFKIEKEKKSVLSKFRTKQTTFKKNLMKILGTETNSPVKESEVTHGLKRLQTFAPRGSMMIKPSIRLPEKNRNWENFKDSIMYKKPKLERRRSLHFHQDLKSIESKIGFFRAVIFPKAYKKLSDPTKLLLKNHYDELMEKRASLLEERQEKKIKNGQATLHQKSLGPWEVLWANKAKEIQEESPYGHFPSYRLRPIIVKGGDDLRQEIIAMQLIKNCQKIFKKEGTNLFLRSYEIIVTSSNSGILGK